MYLNDAYSNFKKTSFLGGFSHYKHVELLVRGNCRNVTDAVDRDHVVQCWNAIKKILLLFHQHDLFSLWLTVSYITHNAVQRVTDCANSTVGIHLYLKR